MSQLLKKFDPIKVFAQTKNVNVVIDNFLAKLHYKFTTMILFICTVLVTSQELIGEHIRCMSDDGVPSNVLNTFCFFTTTYTVVRNSTKHLDRFGKIHPGVGNMNTDEDRLIHHAYYQWVPFVLFLQAFMFYSPHFLWKKLEGGEFRNIVIHLQYAQYSFVDKQIKINDKKLKIDDKDVFIPSVSNRNWLLEQLSKLVLKERSVINKSRCRNFLFCESLYLFNLLFQTYCINVFLGGKFLLLGIKIFSQSLDEVSIFEVVFPKMTKCNFYKYGSSGSIQDHDALCVMALNIINEKIYTCLWFWFLILFAVSILAYLWRILSFCLHKKIWFNDIVFSFTSPGKLDIERIVKRISFSDWLYLVYLSENLDKMVFKQFITYLSKRKEYSDELYEDRQLKEDAYMI